MKERETVDGYTLELAYWSGNFYDVDDEIEKDIQREEDSRVWRNDGDTMEDAFEAFFVDGIVL